MRWEREVTYFSGYAGEVVKGVLYPAIWLTLIPVFFIWAAFLIIFTVILNVAPQLSDPLCSILAYCISSFIIGRYAYGASHGDVNSGFLNTEVEFADPIFFTIRSFVFLLLWQLPLYGIVELMDLSVSAPSLTAATGSLTVVFLLFVLVVMFLGFPMTWLLASASSSFSEIFSKDPWEYVFSTRRRDLPIYLSSIIGASLLFLMIYCIPCLYLGKGIVTFVVGLSVSDPIAAEMMIAVFSWTAIPLIPSMVSGVVIGRLCGAFMQGVATFDDEGVATSIPQPVGEIAGAVAPIPTDASEVSGDDSEEQYLPEDDPSDEVIQWAKGIGAELPEVLSVSVLRYSAEGSLETKIGLAIQIDLETKLSRQQEIKKIISGKGAPGKVLFLTPHNEQEITKVATLIYRRKDTGRK